MPGFVPDSAPVPYYAAVLAGAALALLQACATPGPSDPSLERQAGPSPSIESSPAPSPASTAGKPAIGNAAALDASKLPPFEGERRVMADPLRGVPQIDLTVVPGDLWERIRSGFSMPNLENRLVAEKTAFYAARPDYLQRMFDRGRLYLFHIVEELEKRGMPTELALLPMVESAFNPMAYSRAHASGLWQFIPGTGKRYELKQNWWYDGRRDIVASTTAALDYLSAIYEMQGDWHLALASYNWGENAVARAVEKNRAAGRPTDYASLTMPLETRHYIPKLQALKNIISNPEPLGIRLDPIPNQPYFATTTRLRDIDVQLAAKLAEMKVEEFIALNPGFSRPLIRASVSPRIVLPADKVDVFHENLSRHDQRSLVSWATYRPKKGDTFEAIARRYRMTVARLKEVNGISRRARALPGLLVVPLNGAGSQPRLPIMYAPPIPVSVRKIFHTVKAGESLASIGKRYRVSIADLRRWNPRVRLTPGKRLTIVLKATAKARTSPKSTKKRNHKILGLRP